MKEPAIGNGLNKMSKIKVLHQVLDPSGAGGVSAEYRALSQSSLSEKYEFQPMILSDFRGGVNSHDIKFYYRRIRELKPDIVHIRGAAVDGLNAVIAAKLAGSCKILTTVHGMYSDLVYISPQKRWIAKHVIERLIFSLSDGISCVCKAASERPYFDRYRRKMLPYVYNRIPAYDISMAPQYRKEIREEYGIEENDVVCVFIGRMTKEKGLMTMERVFSILQSEETEHLVFMFVGEGDYRETFEKNCRNMDIRTVFTGVQKDVKKFYMASDFFILPSLHENHSIALLESCAAQIPSIATDCGGNGEIIIDGFSGKLVPVDDSEAICSAIMAFCDSAVRNLYKQNLKSLTFDQFSNKSCDEALDSVYQKILEL